MFDVCLINSYLVFSFCFLLFAFFDDNVTAIRCIQGDCKTNFAWNSAQYIEAERNKYFKRKNDATTFSRQACFVNRFTLQGFNEGIFM